MMSNYNDETLLEMVELYAADNSLIDSEDMLSERFDEEIAPLIIEQHGKKGEEFTDTVMMSEEFSNWSDGLCKDGEIHPIQYDQYCYTGKYS